MGRRKPKAEALTASEFAIRDSRFAVHLIWCLAVVLAMIISCACTSAPPVQEINPRPVGVFWDKEGYRWTFGEIPTQSAIKSDSSNANPPSPHPRSESSTHSAAREIQVQGVPESSKNPIQVQRDPASYREYIKEKFKGRRIVFPEDLPEETPHPVHRIGPLDVLHIYVWSDDGLSMDVVVRADGRISLPLIGEVQAMGLEISELEALLRHRYSRFIEGPQLTVTLKEANSLRIFITGAIRVPTYAAAPITSGFPLRGDRRLLTALSQVEVFPDADYGEAYIVRGDLVIPLDLNRLLKDGDMTQNVMLHPADTVVIPGLVKEVTVLGEVKGPGRFRVKRRTTVLDALATAGGVTRDTADLHLSYVERRGTLLPVDFKRLIDFKDLDQNILLEDGDTIHIISSQENKVFVLGEVNKPGVVRFVDPMDVIEAVSEAGDFLISANRKQVVVVRGGLQEPKVYAINALYMMKGYTHEKFYLDRHDVVFVPRTLIADWNVFITQLLPTLGISNLLRLMAGY